nr:unnamed protein product [Callosobruchus analis]
MDVDSEIQEQEKSEGNTDSRTTLMRMEEQETSKKQHLVCKKVFICYNCYYTSHNRYDIIKHLRRMHTNQRDHNCSRTSNVILNICMHCHTIFKGQQLLDEHVLKKHSGFMNTSKTSRLYECTVCVYKTIEKISFDKHRLTHSDTVLAYNKLHQCQQCSYRTFKKHYFYEHVSRHFGVAPSFKPQTCGHCKVIFKISYINAQNVFIRLLESTHFDRHMSVHPNETTACDELSTCIHCNVRLKATGLDEHIVKKHPDCIESVTCKIYKCSTCPYKTTILKNIERHSSAHPGLL